MRFLFLIVPAAGHINPSLALAEGLIAQGHEVVYYLPEPFTALVAHTSARVRTLPASLALPVDRVSPQDGPLRFKVLRELMIGHSADSLQEVPRLVELAREDAPDAVVYDPMCLWGQIVAKVLRRPSIALYTTFPLHPRSELLSQLMPRLDLDLSWGVLRSVLRLLWASERLHWSYRVPRLRPRAMFTTEEEFSLVPFPREFHPDAQLFDERYQFVGPLITPRPHYSVEPWVESVACGVARATDSEVNAVPQWGGGYRFHATQAPHTPQARYLRSSALPAQASQIHANAAMPVYRRDVARMSPACTPISEDTARYS